MLLQQAWYDSGLGLHLSPIIYSSLLSHISTVYTCNKGKIQKTLDKKIPISIMTIEFIIARLFKEYI